MVVTKGGKIPWGRRVENVHVFRSSVALYRQIYPKSGISKEYRRKQKPRQLNSDVSGVRKHKSSL